MKGASFLILLISLSFANAFAGKETQNGAGLAEQNFAFAYKNLANIFELCWAEINICLQSKEERNLLIIIRNGLAKEYDSLNQLRFESGESNKSRFLIDGNMRVAVTGSQPGDPIFINTDLIYLKDASAKLQPMEMSMAISILGHELGHHYGVLDHAFLDLFGARVRAFTLRKFDFLKWDPYIEQAMIIVPIPYLDVTAIHSRKGLAEEKDGPETQVVVSDNKKLTALNELLEKNLFCPGTTKLKPKGYRLFQLTWAKSRSSMQGSNKLILFLKAGISMTCLRNAPSNEDYPFEEISDSDIQFNLKFVLSGIASEWEFRIDESEVQLTR